MSTTLQAVYEKGMLRLTQPIELDEGTHVEVVIIKLSVAPKSPKEILAKIAALPLIGNTQPFSGQDHDKVLYSIQNNQ
jgi:predicted DNA-binding antitoxin AbrB/MazE fold protein